MSSYKYPNINQESDNVTVEIIDVLKLIDDLPDEFFHNLPTYSQCHVRGMLGSYYSSEIIASKRKHFVCEQDIERVQNFVRVKLRPIFNSKWNTQEKIYKIGKYTAIHNQHAHGIRYIGPGGEDWKNRHEVLNEIGKAWNRRYKEVKKKRGPEAEAKRKETVKAVNSMRHTNIAVKLSPKLTKIQYEVDTLQSKIADGRARKKDFTAIIDMMDMLKSELKDARTEFPSR